MRQLLAYLGMFLISQVSFASAIQSNGTGGGNWHSTSSWSGGVVPGAGDTVSIVNGDTITCESGQTCTAGIAPANDVSTPALQCATAGSGGTGIFVNNGTFVRRGTVKMCGADWTGGPGSTFTHDTNGQASVHYTWQQNYAGKLKVNASSGSHIIWNNAAGSGTAGQLGGNVGYLQGSYVDFNDIGAQGSYWWTADLSASGSEWTCDHCTFNNLGIWYFNNWNSATTFSLTHSNIINNYDDGAQRSLFLIGMGAKTGGTRTISDVYYNASGQIVMQATGGSVDVGLTFQDFFGYVNSSTARVLGIGNTGLEPAFSGTNWNNVLTWLHNPTNENSNVAIDFPAGTLNRTYAMMSTYLNCATQYNLTNYHVSALNGGLSTKLDKLIIETDCSDDGPSNDLIEHFSGSATVEVTNSMSLPAPPHGSQGAFLSFQSSAGTGPADNVHNNTVVCTGVSPSVTSCGIGGVETGAGVADTYHYMRDNICWQTSATYGVGCGAGGNSSSIANLYNTADHNDFFNISGSHYRNSGSVYTNAPGTGDSSVDPQFVDSTRNFLSWCQSLDNTITSWNDCRTRFLNRTSGFTVSALIDWVRAGFAPQNATIATMSSTGSYVGAVAPAAPSSTPTKAVGVVLKGASVK